MILPRVGEELAGYRLQAIVGRGGMSVVYQAENPRFGSAVTLKVLSPELAVDDDFRVRFLQESRIAASLNHPNIVPIYDAGQHEDLLYIAMRFVAGSDLQAVLTKQRYLSPTNALSLIGQAGRALDAAHQHGLVHRDVKPGNILVEHGRDVDDPDHVYLTDFGISHHGALNGGVTAEGEFPWTIDYVAPEQIQGKTVDGRADVYSLGCVLYECLTGRVPFIKDLDSAVLRAHLQEPPTPVGTLQPRLPRGFDDVLARALAKDPDDRYPTCRDLTYAARRVLGGVGEPIVSLERQDGRVAAPSSQPRYAWPADPAQQSGSQLPDGPPALPRAGNGRRRHVIVSALATLALVLAVAVGTLVFSRGGSAQAPPPAAHSTHTTPNALLHALAMTNESMTTKGKLPPRSCHAQSKSVVTCTSPAFGVEMVTFRTYPSLTALYAAYVAEIKSLGDKPVRQNYGNCLPDRTDGEVGWNHDFVHPKNYSIQQMRAGMVTDDQAVGRVFCTFISSGFHIVWTQDDGHLLAVMMGNPHKDAWYWWRGIHHSIVLPGSKHMRM